MSATTEPRLEVLIQENLYQRDAAHVLEGCGDPDAVKGVAKGSRDTCPGSNQPPR